MKNNKFITLDLEFTENREVIQIGAWKWPEEIQYNKYILPFIMPGEHVQNLTGILPDILKVAGIPLEETWAGLTKFGIFNRPVFCWGDDAKLLHPHINGIDFSSVIGILTKRFNAGLTDMCDEFRVPWDKKFLHDASYDAKLLAKLISEVSKRFREIKCVLPSYI